VDYAAYYLLTTICGVVCSFQAATPLSEAVALASLWNVVRRSRLHRLFCSFLIPSCSRCVDIVVRLSEQNVRSEIRIPLESKEHVAETLPFRDRFDRRGGR